MNYSGIFDRIKEGDGPGLEQLLAENPELAHAVNEAGVSALMTALYYGREDMAVMLRQGLDGVDVFEAAALGQTSLLEVMLDGDPGLVGAFASDGFTALHLAVFFGREEAATLLLARGANTETPAQNAMGVAALNSAVAAGQTGCARLLLAAGAQVDVRQQSGHTPLMGAASAGRGELVRLLLAYGADAALTCDSGETALDLALSHGHAEMAVVLSGG